MAYADRSHGGSRITAIIVVTIIMAGLGYAFITGLAYKYVKQVQANLESFDVTPPPPPPPPEEVPPPPETQQQTQPPPVVTPPPLVRTPTQAPPIQTVTTIPPAAPLIPKAAPPVPAAPIAPPAPPAPVISKAAGPKGDPNSWFSTDDYPQRSLNNGDEGTVTIKWDINEAGRVENCTVTSSSGHADLDQATCRILLRRGRYTPAKDQNGNPIRSSASRRVTWKIPQ